MGTSIATSTKNTLSETAKIAAMTEVALHGFGKIKQVKLFIDTLNEIRLGHASRMLIDTSYNITGVAYKCGFNNIATLTASSKEKNCT